MSHTGNPRHPNNPPSDYPQEPTGPVAKDSLANESIQNNGGFADNTNPDVLGVKGYQSTLATEDTSNAETLPPARSGAARERAEYQGMGSDERGTAGGARYPDDEANQTASYGGTTSDQGYRGGSGDASLSGPGSSYNQRETYSTSGSGAFDDAPSSASGGYDPNITSSSAGGSVGTGGARPYVDSAPNYTATDNVRSQGTYKPKGDNLTEDVDNTDIPPNKGTYMGDVGGPKDPGRLAEQNFQKDAYAGTAGQASDYGNADSGNKYDDLARSEDA